MPARGKNTEPTTPRRVQAKLIRARCLEYRVAGLSYEQMAERIGQEFARKISPQACNKAVAKALSEVDATMGETAQEVMQQELLRLDRMLLVNLNRAVPRGVRCTNCGAQYPRGTECPNIITIRDGENKVIDTHVCGGLLVAREPDPKSTDQVLAIMGRRAKYLGLDAPTRHEFITKDALSTHLEKLEAELARRGGDTPIPDHESIPG